MASGHSNWVSNPDEDRGPMVAAVLWCLTAVTGFILGLRIYVRVSLRRVQLDDVILLFAWCTLLVVSILNQLLVNLGFGMHSLDVPFGNLNQIATLGASGLTVSTIGINAAKISFAVTLLHLTKNLWKWTNWLIWVVIISLVLLAVPVAVLPWVQCRPLVKTFVDFWPGECIDKAHSVRYGTIQGVYSAITDFTLALLPWKILWALQMRPIEKVGVGIAMSLGMAAGAMAILRSMALYKLSSIDVSYDGVVSTMWATIELSVTIVAACIPVLRAFVKEQVSTIRTGLSKNSRLKSTARGTAGNSRAGGSTAYQLTRMSGRFDAHKNGRQWFTVAEYESENDAFENGDQGDKMRILPEDAKKEDVLTTTASSAYSTNE
ncbi:uncharacterized protein B0I36DRAFT_96709 [Microdochium trichocladiopsis]|uniref:Rhodopsin domain-containing protein n=1 Tax=Microdochium trichocladiopsis TaxID=1682393 RepID=A0A9P9BTN2_9PEZI|nr:uncharacterized protein B0I36DRAFT_96709 [Microdochium trichocladiopsis]KAH7035774.1 hypothetical protein B0I36DRAFT_96709 [Microdochium trichocladiopsis]